MIKNLLISLTMVFVLVPLQGLAQSACTIKDGKAVIETGEDKQVIDVEASARMCVRVQDQIFVAAGSGGVLVYSLAGDEPGRQTGVWIPDGAEVLAVHLGTGGLVAITAKLEAVPLELLSGGGLKPAGLSAYVQGMSGFQGAPVVTPESGARAPVRRGGSPAGIAGKVIEVRPDEAVLDVGSNAGVKPGDRFEIRAQELKKQYDLATGDEVLLPSNEITAVVNVKSVSADKALVVLARGDRAQINDLAARTDRALTGTRWFPGYERNLNRIQARLAPYLGISSLNGGMFTSLMYDRTFSFPMRVEAGFRNVAFVFGDHFSAPFHLDAIPSYDTDYFEIGIGLGYVYSSHERGRGLNFLQKVRLGTVDGLNITVQNAFIYQRSPSIDMFFDMEKEGTATLDIGDDCAPDGEDRELTGWQFNWQGIDGVLSIPLTTKVTLITNHSYSNAGWYYGDIGIRTLIMGNGGSGTLHIPVTIGGVMVRDFVKDGSDDEYCDAKKKQVTSMTHYDEKSYGGPVVSIGVDYRWR
jgi:hypothetical protein